MGLFDRQYWRQDSGYQPGGSRMSLGIPRPGRVVKVLLILNCAVFVVQMFADAHGTMSRSLGVTVAGWWQIWRYITFQFLHGGVWHIVLNMLGLYLLGTPLEQRMGGRNFTIFYLACGVIAGLAYVMIGWLFSSNHGIPIIGASGGVYAIVLACAVFFPHMQLIFLFFPVPIRLAAVIIFGAMLLMVAQSIAAHQADSAMSDVAHLGGAVAAAVWIWVLPRLRESYLYGRQRQRQGAWERKMAQRRSEQDRIDAILKKIHDEGISSLTSREKKVLQEASRRQDREDSEISRL